MTVFKCKMCGGTIEFEQGATIGVCDSCGTKQTLPKTDEDVLVNLFNRANNLRLKCEFDKAEQIYEKIVQQDDSEAEAHWGIVLCKYGIEYVEDPKTFERIPTCHRTLFEAVTKDPDYLAAIDYSDAMQQSMYESEARAIDRIQRDILAIVKEEKPFDVFICYKETDENGNRTVDSTIANDIYHQLTREGYKVFYAAITLEDKLGHEYEPYIFAALNSSKVMLVVGTKPDFFTSVWVKNEWSRFLKLMKTDRSKLLIPCYRDMDAYDLPEEFAHLQALDMSKIGFIQDLIRGIQKLLGNNVVSTPDAQPEVVGAGSSNISALLKRGKMALEDGEWENAQKYFDEVLNNDAECAEAYLGLAMADREIDYDHIEQMTVQDEDIDRDKNYKKAKKFAKGSLKEQIIAWANDKKDRLAKEAQLRAAEEKARQEKIEEQKRIAEERESQIEELQKKIDELDSKGIVYSSGDLEAIHKFEEELEIKRVEVETRKAECDQRSAECDRLSQMISDHKSYKRHIAKQKENEKNQLATLVRQKREQRDKMGIFKKKEKEKLSLEIGSLTKQCDDLQLQIIGLKKEIDTIDTPKDMSIQEVDVIHSNYNESFRRYRESLADYESVAKGLDEFKNELLERKKKDIEDEKRSLYEEIQKMSFYVGGTVRLGNWHSEEQLEWIVLDQDDDKFLLLSNDIVDCKTYEDEFTIEAFKDEMNELESWWAGSGIRKWLNGEFYESAFDHDERAMIIRSLIKSESEGNPELDDVYQGPDVEDYVFLLSYKEATVLFEDDKDRLCNQTEYAEEKGRNIKASFRDFWMLRSMSSGCVVETIDSVEGCFFEDDWVRVDEPCGVRPAIWIKLKP